ncbi:manganese efflux pump MntP family protein [Bacillus sp. FJAT-50079]|uniref:manganese efflux pump MntP n=1 Tax=Bacillus sp. FJAT-50079 TaxID=2833577 RepID=UPI001BC99A86|nr:manganese efflux pump MntP family protein [Bacillus sp. FJAT-50079]MBS4206803.1 manganese efflux pump [Bacillus sp. FJAT-50079]
MSEGKGGRSILHPEIITLLIMAFAVGMDAFSISLGMGIYQLRLRQIFYIGLIVGFFHVVMPLLGIFAGYLLSGTFGRITDYIGGCLLIIIGVQMIISVFQAKKERASFTVPVGKGLIIFSFIVSLDSFSAGLSLGIFGVRAAAAVICFGLVASILTWGALIIGRRVENLLGAYGELLGGIILFLFGIKLLLPL